MRVEAEFSAKHVVERSRFHAYLFPATSEAEIKAALVRRRKEFKKANHHCWAARLLTPGGIVERCRDDGEVGHPGRKILGLLQHKEIEGALIVSRVFGGVKLGPAGVGRAFLQAAQAVLALAAPPERGGDPKAR